MACDGIHESEQIEPSKRMLPWCITRRGTSRVQTGLCVVVLATPCCSADALEAFLSVPKHAAAANTTYHQPVMVRIVIAEDSALLRDGLIRLFERIPDIEVVGSCGSLPDLLELIEQVVPDVVLTDIRMPPTGTDEGIQAARMIRKLHPQMGVVVLSQYASPSYALKLFEDGSDGRGYLLKDRVSDVEDVGDAIRAVAQGQSMIDPKVIDELVTARSRRSPSPVEILTAREREILAEIATGKSNGAIATHLFVSERAVEKHSNSIFAKLGIGAEPDVNRRVKAVLLFLSSERVTQDRP